MVRDRLLLTAFLLSGAAALGYELVWTRLLALALGSEILGVLAALAGFFGGLALGSFALHGPVRRSADPVRLFAALESVAALYAAFSPHLLNWLALKLPPLLGRASSGNDNFAAVAVSLAVATAALLPATFCMGATLAALTEARIRVFPGEIPGRGMGRLYAANTLGATAGALTAVYLLMPALGLSRTALVFAGLGLASAATALIWNQRVAPLALNGGSRRAVPEAAPSKSGSPALWLHGALFVTGLAGVGLEVAGVQILAQNMQNTVYTFVNVLAVYLLGTALGAWLYSIWGPRLPPAGDDAKTAALLLVQSLAVVLAAYPLRWSEAILEAVAGPGSGRPWRLAGEFAAAAAVFGPPTLLMGAVFSQISGRLARLGVGRAYALNTLGSTLAPFVFGAGILNWLGYGAAFYASAAVYLLLYTAFVLGRRTDRRRAAAGVAAVALLAAVAPRSMVLIDSPPDWRVVFREAGLYGLVMVTERIGDGNPGASASRRLQVNRHFRMGGANGFGEQRMGHIPLLLAPDAEVALFLGIGTGATLGAVRDYSLREVEAVELVPGVLRALPLFADANRSIGTDPRVRFHTADARRFVAASRTRFDLVVADLFHPARDGAGSLYALEHFAAIRARLRPGGLFVQWVPLHQFDSVNFKTLTRTFLDVFPEVHSFIGLYNAETPALALVGSASADSPLRVDLERLQSKLSEPVYGDLLLRDAREFFASYMLDRPALERYAGPGALNTDLNPRILFDAPGTVYERPPGLRWTVLGELLPLRTDGPSSLLTASDPAALQAFREQTRDFSRAITLFLQAEIARVSGPDERVVPPEAIELYLSAFNQAPDFGPAAGVLHFLAAKNPRVGVAIFSRMLQRAPERESTWRELLKFLEELGDASRLQRFRELARRRFGERDWNAPPG